MNAVRFLPPSASTFAADYDRLFWFFMLSCGLAFIVTFAVMIGAALRYRYNANRYSPDRGHAHTWVEVAWSLPVFFVVTVLFVWGARIYIGAYTVPEDAMEIFVTGKQWMWKVQHPNGKREINELHIPSATPVRLTLTSEDVIHSFYIPAFRTKRDVLPGKYTDMWFEATEEGEFHLFCAEYCGTEHSRMVGRVVVLSPSDYEEWSNLGQPLISMADHGRSLYERHSCGTCHDQGDEARGPSLAGVFGNRRPLATGHTVLANETYIRESIIKPNKKVVLGYDPVMPTYRGQIDDEEMNQLVAYIRSLQPEPVVGDQASVLEVVR